ncbi:MAG: hypothetical protein ACLP59_13710 [Bryobacteraceae bacterium]
MKTLKTVMLSVGAVALLGASGLYAQTRATADIPFEFTVANTTLPAGEYTMSAVPAARDLMSIRNDQTGKQILVLASSAEKGYRGANEKNVVVFHQAGVRYFLSAVKTDAVCGRVPPSKVERELASAGAGETVAAVIVPALIAR